MEIWKRNLIILWISQFLAMAGMSAVVPFLPLFIRELGVTSINETATWSGFVFAGPFVVSFFITPLWGVLGDKYGRKLMTLRAIYGLAISQVLIGFSQNVEQLFIFRILQGLLSGFYPAALALTAATTPKEKTGYALGMIQSASLAGNIIGPLIGGVLSDFLGYRNVFFVVGTLVLVTGICITFLINEPPRESQESKNYSFFDNLKFIFSSKYLWIVGVLIFMSAFGEALLRPIFVLYIESFHIEMKFLPTVTGALYSIVGIFSTLSSALFGKRIDKIGIKKTLSFGALTTGGMYLIHFFVESIPFLIPIRIFLGLGYGIIIPVLFTALSKDIPDVRKGGIMGIGSSFQILGNMLGPITSGTLVIMFGLRPMFLFAGVIFLIIGLISQRLKTN